MSNKHGWNTWENYLRVHESVLRKYQANFISPAPKYSVIKFTEYYYQLTLKNLELKTRKGTVVCINIEKDVEVRPGGTKQVARTEGYSYQAWLKGGRNLVRYDSPHVNHNKFHHKHDYLYLPKDVLPVKNDEWPHVSEFFDEIINNF